MDAKALLFYFNIYVIYLLQPIMTAMGSEKRYCGPLLADTMSLICAGRGYNSVRGPGPSSPRIRRETASSFLITNTDYHPRGRRLRRRTGQIVTECCEKTCTEKILETYCNSGEAAPTLAASPAASPSATSLKTQQPSPSGPGDDYPMRDNVLREDYEPPTNGGDLTSGRPTPTENRISSGLREISNFSIELPSRTANSSRASPESSQDGEDSDQSSLETEDSDSEVPTRSTGNEGRKKKPQRNRPRGKNKKTSQERREEKKKKKQLKKERDRQRSNSHRHRGRDRESSRPSPTGEGRNEPNNSDDTRNRGKNNQSQKPAGSHQNDGGQEDDLLKIEKILASLQEVTVDLDSEFA